MLLEVVVHTPTLEEYIEVVSYCLDVLRIYWWNGNKTIGVSRWDYLKEKTCLRIYTYIDWSAREFYEEKENMKILSVDEFLGRNYYKTILKEFK